MKEKVEKQAKHRFRIILVICLLVIAAAAAMVIILSLYGSHDGSGMDGEYQEITWDGARYRYNDSILTCVVAGLDTEDSIKDVPSYTFAPRADSIQLIILDTSTKQLKVLGLNRDIMTRIRKYTVDGLDRGLFTDHLALAYSYGNGGSASCRSLCEAVSLLLHQIPVQNCVAVNLEFPRAFARCLGPVEVIVPDDTLGVIDEQYQKGATAVIDETNVELYIRTRDHWSDHSNTDRMERQRSYIMAAGIKVLDQIKQNPLQIVSWIQDLKDTVYVHSDLKSIRTFLSRLSDIDYNRTEYLALDGELTRGEFYEEFYPDQDALMEFVLDTFYIRLD